MKRKILKYVPFFVLISAAFTALLACGDLKSFIFEVVSLEVTKRPNRTSVYVGEPFTEFHRIGMEVTATFSDGKKEKVGLYDVAWPSTATPGEKSATVSYGGKSAGFKVTVIPITPPVSIAVTTPPAKTGYFINDSFDPAGLVITAYYISGNMPIADYSLSRPDMASAGEKTVSVSFGGQKTSFTINVKAITAADITGITVTQEPEKTTYFVNEAFDPEGLVITAVHSGNMIVVSGYTLSTPNMSTPGTPTVTVTFGSRTTTFKITVIALPTATLNSIAVTKDPAKTVYFVNEAFDPAGLAVTAAYSDGLIMAVSGYTLSTPDMNTVGPQTVTVTFETQTAAFDITVKALPTATLDSIAVTQDPAKTVYFVNEAFEPAGLVVTASYSDGQSMTVSGYDLIEPDMSVAGPQTVTVTFETQTAGFTITVQPSGDLDIIIY